MPTINVGDAELHYRIDDFTDPWKPAETVLLHHGAGRHSGFWYSWIPLLSRQYRVLRFDARGHGLSSKPEPGHQWDLETLSDDVVKLLDALDVERVHYVGESAGGLIGLLVALDHANRLHSLTLCGGLFRASRETQQHMGAGGQDWLPSLAQMGQREWVMQTMHTRVDVEKMSPEFLAWFADESAVVPQHVMENMVRCVAATDLHDRLPDIGIPTLILAPEYSTVAPLHLQRIMRRRIPDARLVVLKGHRHAIVNTAPERCVRALLRFLQGL
ncbi:MAG: alpha/beta hydrolase [Chloroflexi bacterium]|nr:alpha/beta hydrolase [Chloroflexota bacterium]